MAVEWIWLVFIFAFGACIGSFLNVVVYRLPRDKSLVTPPSACPACDTPIRFYNNIPLFSWLILRGKCPDCKAPISIRYFFVELLTAIVFVGLYLCFFWFQYRQTGLAGGSATQQFFGGGWLFYLVIATLFAVFIAASAIDMELWIIPLELCWFVTIVGLIGAAIAPYGVDWKSLQEFHLFPSLAQSPRVAAVTVGATAGLILSLIGLYMGIIKPSYEMAEDEEGDCEEAVKGSENEPEFDDRKEILKEIVFLLPVVLGALIAFYLVKIPSVADKWYGVFYHFQAVPGFMGALAGYLAGCAVVWAVRILGTLAFNKEAMGLGDVHLMGAAGAVIGAKWVILAFFLAPFFGILWALYQAIFKKMRQIPYGPFLSLAVFVVIIFHDWMQSVLQNYYGF